MSQSQMKQTRSAAISTALPYGLLLVKATLLVPAFLTLKHLFNGSNCTLQLEAYLPSGTHKNWV